jgi:hypothetical protein
MYSFTHKFLESLRSIFSFKRGKSSGLVYFICTTGNKIVPGHHSTKYIFCVTPSMQQTGKRFIRANRFVTLISISIGTCLFFYCICIQAFLYPMTFPASYIYLTVFTGEYSTSSFIHSFKTFLNSLSAALFLFLIYPSTGLFIYLQYPASHGPNNYKDTKP